MIINVLGGLALLAGVSMTYLGVANETDEQVVTTEQCTNLAGYTEDS